MTATPYLRRRLKPGEAAKAATAAPTPSLGLSLGAHNAVPTETVPKRAPDRRVDGVVELTAEQPAVVLRRSQSGIGSLAVTAPGAAEVGCIWELDDLTTGVVWSAAPHPEARLGRRSVANVEDGVLHIGLRHVRRLRRLALLVNGGELEVRISLRGGGEIRLRTEPGQLTVPLVGYQDNGELVLRRERGVGGSVEAALDAYGFRRP